MNMKKLVCAVLLVALLVPELALASGFTGGTGAFGVYRVGNSVYQAWYETPVVEDGAEYILGVYDECVYYQTAPVGGVSSLIRQPLHLVSDEYIQADGTMENVVVATGGLEQKAREGVTLSESVLGRAVLDETSGYVYYVDAARPDAVRLAAEYPALGLQDVELYAADSPVEALRLTVNGLAFKTATGAYLFLPMLSRAIPVNPGVFDEYKQSEMYNGFEVLLTPDGVLELRLDAANGVYLTINDSVQEFALHDGCVYYLRRTRWLTDIYRFDPVTRSSKVLTRMMRELMGQLVCAGEYIFIIDTEYTVYRVSPSTGKYAVYMKLAGNYEGVIDDVEPACWERARNCWCTICPRAATKTIWNFSTRCSWARPSIPPFPK